MPKQISRTFWLSVFFLLTIFAVPCSAGYVTLETQLGAQTTGNRVEIAARISNLGNDPANFVTAELEVLGKKITGQAVPREKVIENVKKAGAASLLDYHGLQLQSSADKLDSKQCVVFTYTLELPQGVQGSFPVILHIGYRDMNSLPFSSLAGIVVKTPGAPEPGVQAQIREKPGSPNPLILITLTNTTQNVIQAKARLAAPDSLSCKEPLRSLTLLPGKPVLVDFEVENLADRAGDHALFFILEYDGGGYHRCLLSTTTLKVKPRDHWFSRTRSWWMGLDVILACLFGGVWLLSWRRPSI
ncbi:hypothetical protein Dalk_3441 [Desulfatibacillum aliphaticivorans]|uniref:Uncharacterized protein n=1 Tax=Desulfatibacillum aliphaticivorans TaxID=218208 RepID=B8FLI3_DESAL|nr:hypothetical protein [Desulfatibacillum aliphaticivorans]ACL05129.1 hypothetical protein Dalk_3441 [Desulfatibacillum aliphaticivorans]